MINFATACSGIGVPDIAAHKLGWESVFACEREPFPRAVLEHRFGYGKPGNAPLLDDMLEIDAAAYPQTNAFIAGTPCQSFSIAGLRGGIKDARGNLTLKFVELCHAFQDTADAFRWAVWENVPGVLSDKENAFGTFISALVGGNAPALPPGSEASDFTPEGQLEIRDGTRRRPRGWPSAGMVEGPRARLAWRVLDAQYFGVPQRRRRVFIVVSFGPGDPAKVLFEPRRRDGNPSTRRKKGKGIAAATLRSSDGGSDVDHAAGGHLIPASGFVPDIVGQAISSKWAKGSSGPAGDEIANLIGVELAHALTGEGHDASDDGTGRGTPLIAINGRQDPCPSDLAGALDSDGASQVIAFSGKDYGADAGDLAPTLRAMGHSGSHANAGGQVAIASALAVRRLTPRECERCQGLPDDWTLIPNWNAKRPNWKRDLEQTARWLVEGEIYETEEDRAARWAEALDLASMPDGPRYKAIGNAWAYPCGEWILKRIDAEDRATFRLAA